MFLPLDPHKRNSDAYVCAFLNVDFAPGKLEGGAIHTDRVEWLLCSSLVSTSIFFISVPRSESSLIQTFIVPVFIGVSFWRKDFCSAVD